MHQNKKKLPIGIDNFEKLRLNDFYYVDKTGLIKELLNNLGRSEFVHTPEAIWKIIEYEYAGKFLFDRKKSGYISWIKDCKRDNIMRRIHGKISGDFDLFKKCKCSFF